MLTSRAVDLVVKYKIALILVLKLNRKMWMKWFSLFPLIVPAAFVPLVVRMAKVPFWGNKHEAFLGYEVHTDFFFWGKSLLVMGCGCLSLFCFLLPDFRKALVEKHSRYFFLSLLFAALWVCLSSFFSEYPEVAWLGFPGIYEGGLVLISYFALCGLSYLVAKKDQNLKLLFFAIAISGSVIGFFGLCEYFGIFLFNTPLLQNLIWPKDGQSFLFHYPESGIISSTLGNSNQVGSLATLLFPLSIVFFLFSKGKGKTLFTALLSCLFFTLLVGSHSRAAYLGGTVSLLLLLYLLRSHLGKLRDRLFLIFLCDIFLLLTMMSHSRHFEASKEKTSYEISTSLNQKFQTAGFQENLKDISITEGKLILQTEKTGLVLEPVPSGFILRNLEFERVPVKVTDGMVHTLDPRLEDFRFRLFSEGTQHFVEVIHPNFRLTTVLLPTGFKIVERNSFRVPITPRKFPLLISDVAGSGRGYIWSRSLPLLDKTLVLGRGPGTFAFDFPQNDYLGKWNTFANFEILVDRPHNGYLQFAHSIGLLGLLVLLALFSRYWFQSWNWLRNSYNSENFYPIRLGIFVSLSGYWVNFFFHDSFVGVSPLFWILLGIGCRQEFSTRVSKETAG